MISIWAGSLTRPSDIIKLEAILENLHTYAINELRPWISSSIEQWLDLFPMDGSPPRTISEKPFAELESAQTVQPELENAADLQTPQPDSSQRTAVSGASFDKQHHTFDPSSISFRFTPPHANGNGQGVGDGHAAAQRSERTKLGPRPAKSSAPLSDSHSPTSSFGSNAPAVGSFNIPAFDSPNAPTSGFGSKASTSLFASSTSTITFGSTPPTFGLTSKSPVPQFSSSALAELVDENHAKEPDYGTSRLVPPTAPGGRGRKSSRRVKSQEGMFSDAKAGRQRSHSQGLAKRMQGTTLNGRI